MVALLQQRADVTDDYVQHHSLHEANSQDFVEARMLLQKPYDV